MGPNAGDLISEVALAIEMGCEAEDIALTIHPHPTFLKPFVWQRKRLKAPLQISICQKKPDLSKAFSLIGEFTSQWIQIILLT